VSKAIHNIAVRVIRIILRRLSLNYHNHMIHIYIIFIKYFRCYCTLSRSCRVWRPRCSYVSRENMCIINAHKRVDEIRKHIYNIIMPTILGQRVNTVSRVCWNTATAIRTLWAVRVIIIINTIHTHIHIYIYILLLLLVYIYTARDVYTLYII
jgi:hypothetical protein